MKKRILSIVCTLTAVLSMCTASIVSSSAASNSNSYFNSTESVKLGKGEYVPIALNILNGRAENMGLAYCDPVGNNAGVTNYEDGDYTTGCLSQFVNRGSRLTGQVKFYAYGRQRGSDKLKMWAESKNGTSYKSKAVYTNVTVYNAPSSIKLNKTSLTLNARKSYTLSETTNSGSYANATNLKWSSNNTKVATVTKGRGNKATIHARIKGTAYITVKTYNGKTAKCKVTVK